MTLQERNDPMGAAIRDYSTTGRCGRLRVLSPQFEEDELPVPLLFRAETEMPPLERLALDKARGRVLDTGAGAGCHTLALQQRGLDVTAIDISPGAVRTMRRRGVEDARLCDFFEDDFGGPFDTVLMLMNGIGICGRLERLPFFFTRTWPPAGTRRPGAGRLVRSGLSLRRRRNSGRALLRRGRLPDAIRKGQERTFRLAVCGFPYPCAPCLRSRLQGRAAAQRQPLRLSGTADEGLKPSPPLSEPKERSIIRNR